jgi:TolB-like protein/Tfp pilus assembly protein PilF
VAWLLIQVAGLVFPQLQLPDWAPTLVTVLLALGFPVALILAWAFELTPEGIRPSAPSCDGQTERQGGPLDYALIAGLVLVAAVTLRGQLLPGSGGNGPGTGTTPGTASIAVMPFADMSPNGDQEYFGDGIAEELLNGLTRLDGLRVAGRTSSFAYKNSTETVPAIGNALGVGTILEGSVRKDGDRIRITAQLVDVADGYHLWSETYDRQFTDIFSVQEEIAAEVAGALGVRLGVGDANAFRGAGTSNVEAYEAYLQGAAARLRDDSGAAVRFLDRAIALDPNYAAAWAERAIVRGSMMWQGPVEQAPDLLELASADVRRAVELDPGSAEAHSRYGTVLYAGLRWSEGHAEHERALALRADREMLLQYGNLLFRAGRVSAAQSQYLAAEAAERLDGRPVMLHEHVSVTQGRFDEAKKLATFPGMNVDVSIDIVIAANEGDDAALRRALTEFPRSLPQSDALYAPVLAVYDSPEAVRSQLQAVYEDSSVQWPSRLHDIAMLAAYFDAPELALQAKWDEARYAPVRLFALWYPVMAPVRQLPEFKTFMREVNLVDYWRTYGWADACRPLDGDDFVCT